VMQLRDRPGALVPAVVRILVDIETATSQRCLSHLRRILSFHTYCGSCGVLGNQFNPSAGQGCGRQPSSVARF
jgi:hypothetical protein